MASSRSSSCVAIARCLVLGTLAVAGEGVSSDRGALRGAKRKVSFLPLLMLACCCWCMKKTFFFSRFFLLFILVGGRRKTCMYGLFKLYIRLERRIANFERRYDEFDHPFEAHPKRRRAGCRAETETATIVSGRACRVSCTPAAAQQACVCVQQQSAIHCEKATSTQAEEPTSRSPRETKRPCCALLSNVHTYDMIHTSCTRVRYVRACCAATLARPRPPDIHACVHKAGVHGE